MSVTLTTTVDVLLLVPSVTATLILWESVLSQSNCFFKITAPVVESILKCVDGDGIEYDRVSAVSVSVAYTVRTVVPTVAFSATLTK